MNERAKNKKSPQGRPDVRAVILAGGRGTRFWPLGRAARPKQFLPIISRLSMIEETVRRLRPLIRTDRVWTVADAGQTRSLRKIFTQIPRANFVVEPLAKNTAPSLMLATAKIFLDNPEAAVGIFPADHVIREPKKFLHKLAAAVEVAIEKRCIVTFGITPTFPATGYGYIRCAKDKPFKRGRDVFYPVRAFKEKPPLALAEKYLAAGDSSWNSGMFIWRADVFAENLKAYAPVLYGFWTRTLEALTSRDRSALRRIFEDIPSVSIDYALMEKAQGVMVCEGDFGWSDVGAWSALYDIWKRDEAGNVVRGKGLALDATGCLVYNPDRLTALVGVKDLIVVQTDDALLVCSAREDQRVKEIVETLKKTGGKKYL